LNDLTDRVQQLAELIGPNIYLQAAIIAAVFIIVGKIADLVISGVVGRIAERSSNDFDDSLIDLVHRPIFVTSVIIGLALATKRLDMPELPTRITVNLLKTIAIFIWFGAFNSLNKLVVGALRKSTQSQIVQSGMLTLLHNIMKVVLFALAGYFFFLAWDIDVTAWLASAGIVGLALSFAAKDTLSNLFAGVSIVMDAPYKTGDFIILDSGERGVVTEIGLRSTRILTRDDVEITIPNGIISDVDHVIETLEQVAADNAAILAIPAPRVRFRLFGDSSLNFELLGWIADPADRGRVQHELNCAVYKALAANKIEIPFPQRDLHVRTMPAGD
jgi:small-conductance mechanosensitive channel